MKKFILKYFIVEFFHKGGIYEVLIEKSSSKDFAKSPKGTPPIWGTEKITTL